MKFAILTSLTVLAVGLSAAATPCFHAGTYKGKGFGWDAAGKLYPYEVTTTLTDSAQGTSTYTWAGGGASFQFAADKGALLIDGKQVGGTIQCGMASDQLHLPLGNLSLDEEWAFVGNYLLRRGTKSTSSGTIDYQELLVREQ